MMIRSDFVIIYPLFSDWDQQTYPSCWTGTIQFASQNPHPTLSSPLNPLLIERIAHITTNTICTGYAPPSSALHQKYLHRPQSLLHNRRNLSVFLYPSPALSSSSSSFSSSSSSVFLNSQSRLTCIFMRTYEKEVSPLKQKANQREK